MFMGPVPVQPDQQADVETVQCRGCWQLSSACGHCASCKRTALAYAIQMQKEKQEERDRLAREAVDRKKVTVVKPGLSPEKLYMVNAVCPNCRAELRFDRRGAQSSPGRNSTIYTVTCPECNGSASAEI